MFLSSWFLSLKNLKEPVESRSGFMGDQKTSPTFCCKHQHHCGSTLMNAVGTRLSDVQSPPLHQAVAIDDLPRPLLPTAAADQPSTLFSFIFHLFFHTAELHVRRLSSNLQSLHLKTLHFDLRSLYQPRRQILDLSSSLGLQTLKFPTDPRVTNLPYSPLL